MKPRLVFAFVLLCGLAGSITSTWLNQKALASRNSSGTFSLYTPGNPVQTGSTISSSWANNTFTDMGNEITNSLDRGGRGGMTAPLKLTTGSVSAPAMTFSAEMTSGIYRNASNDIRMSVGGTDVSSWNTTTLTALNELESKDNVFADDGVVVDNNNANSVFNVGTISNSLKFGGAGTGEGIASKRAVSGSGQFGLDFYTAGVNRMSLNNGGGVIIPGQFAGTPGNTISGSYAGVYTVSFGTLSALSAVTQNVTLSGAATNSTCDVSSNLGSIVTIGCYVLSSNTVQLVAKNSSGGTFTVNGQPVFVRVWNN